MNDSQKPSTFCVSDETITCYGIRVLSDGIDTTAFESNPVMFYMHQRGKVFGKWENLRLDNGKWYAEPVFDEEDTDEEVRAIAGKVNRGFLRAASIGVEVVEMIWNEALQCFDAIKSILQEISIVDIPGNRNALRLYKNGEPLKELELSAHLEQFRPTTTVQSNPTNTMSLNLKTLALAASLPEDATEQQVSQAIVQLAADAKYKQKYEELVKEQKKAKEDQALELVNAAQADGRIKADMKDSYLALFALDYDGTAKILSSLSKPTNLVTFANNGQAASQAAESMTAEEATKKWNDLDKSGMLLKLKNNDLPAFKALYQARWGKEFTA